MPRRRFKQTAPFDQRLSDEAQRLRKEAQGTPPGFERERLIRRARQAETASHVNQWLSSPGLRGTKVIDFQNRSPLIIQAAEVLRRARKLPTGPAKDRFRRLALGLLRLHRAGIRATVQIVEGPTKH
jgi:hypothetical protein